MITTSVYVPFEEAIIVQIAIILDICELFLGFLINEASSLGFEAFSRRKVGVWKGPGFGGSFPSFLWMPFPLVVASHSCSPLVT